VDGSLPRRLNIVLETHRDRVGCVRTQSADFWKPRSSQPATLAAWDRLRASGCIDAALDGQLAEKFPDSNGKPLVVQVDCYNIPREAVESFFDEFSTGVFTSGCYKGAERKNPYVSSIGFAITFDSIH
jgi:hypothetical protein